MHSLKRKYTGWLLYTIASFFLAYQMALQVSPGVMAHQLMHDLHLDASDLGFMGGSYFWAYTLMQIPAGCFFDHINIRTLLMSAVLLCTLSTFGFVFYSSVMGLTLMRFIIGAASAFSFTAVLVVAARCLPEKQFPLFVGITQLVAALGGMVGGSPIAYSVQNIGWKLTTIHLGYIGLSIFFTMFLFFRSSRFKPITTFDLPSLRSKMKNIATKQQTWWIGLYAIFNWGPITLLAALWGEPFLMAKYHMSLTKAALLIDMIWLGVCIAPPIFGYLSSNVRLQRPIMLFGATLGMSASTYLLYGPCIAYPWLIGLCFCLGVASSAQILTFSMVKNLHSSDHVGTAVGFNNMAVVAGGALLQPLLGSLLKAYWSGGINAHGAAIYTLNDFHHAVWVIPACYALSLLACAKINYSRESHHA